MEYRKKFILDVHYGIFNVQDYSWPKIEEIYDYVKTLGAKPGDRARKHYNWYMKKGRDRNQWAPSHRIDEIDVDKLTLNSTWQVQTKGGGVKWLESYKNNVTKQEIEQWKRQLINDVSTFSPSFKPQKYILPQGNLTYVISLPDLHFGKQDLKQTSDEVDRCFDELIGRVGGVTQFVVPIGNDLFHSEGMSRKTTKGTLVEDFSEWKRCFRHVWQHMAERLIYLSERAPVHVPIVQGNHDWARTFYLGDVLYAYMMNNKDITVDNSFTPRKYFHFGKTLIGWDHGDRINPKEYPIIMATERSVEFANSDTRIMFTGHLHHQRSHEIRGVQVKYMPSISPTDEWHERGGFRAQRAAQGYKFDDRGLVGYEETRI